MPKISQSTLAYLPQRPESHAYRKPAPEKLKSVSDVNVNINLHSIENVPSKAARRGAGALLKTPLGKALLALVAVAAVGVAVGVPVGVTLSQKATNSATGITTTPTTITSTTGTSVTTSTSTSSTSTSLTFTSTTSTSTVTATLPPTYMYWPMDSNFNDFYNVYNGVGMNSPTFVTPGYNGYGAALSVNAANSQYVLVSLYKNMTFTSFTWEIWGYPTNLSNPQDIWTEFDTMTTVLYLDNYDNLMVGMCQTPTNSRCLYLMIRNNSTYFAFYANDCWSATIIPINQWHHFGFVYDYSAQAQYIYLNGYLACTHTSASSFLAASGAITIGAINNTGTTPGNFWTGYIDEVQYVSRAKSAAELLADATLVASYSFDNGSFYDSGPNRINGTWINLTSVTGRVNQGILLNGNGQAFKVTGLTLMGATYRSYSISVWIYRSSPATGNGTIIHLSALPAGFGAWCLPILGLSASYQVIGQNRNSSWVAAVTGPVIPLTTWVHLVTSYSAANGVRLWVNGTLIGSTGPFSYSPSTVPNTIIAGSSLASIGNCAAGNIMHGQFYGMIDELRIYARELNGTEVATLANP